MTIAKVLYFEMYQPLPLHLNSTLDLIFMQFTPSELMIHDRSGNIWFIIPEIHPVACCTEK